MCRALSANLNSWDREIWLRSFCTDDDYFSTFIITLWHFPFIVQHFPSILCRFLTWYWEGIIGIINRATRSSITDIKRVLRTSAQRAGKYFTIVKMVHCMSCGDGAVDYDVNTVKMSLWIISLYALVFSHTHMFDHIKSTCGIRSHRS